MFQFLFETIHILYTQPIRIMYTKTTLELEQLFILTFAFSSLIIIFSNVIQCKTKRWLR